MKNLFSEKDITVEFFNNELLVKGPLTQDTVVAAITRSEPLIPREQSVTINLSEVRDCDSASLAFIMALLRIGKAKKSPMQLLPLPKEMLDLATVSGLNGFLPLKDK